MADSPYDAYTSDPTVYLYTSLTAGSSHIITATSRLETILKANKIPFRAIDVATDEKARMLWGRRSKGRKLPGLVRYGMIVGDLTQIEDWNEFGELKMQIGSTEGGGTAATTTAPTAAAPTTTSAPPSTSAATTTATSRPTSTAPHVQIGDTPSRTSSAASNKDEQRYTTALRQAGEEAASKAKENTRSKLGVQPTSSLGRTEEAVAETAASSEEPTTTKEDDKKEESESAGKEKAEDGDKEESKGVENDRTDKKEESKTVEKDKTEEDKKEEPVSAGKEAKEEDNGSTAEPKSAEKEKKEENDGGTAEPKSAEEEKKEEEDSTASLKTAQRRASVQADAQGSNVEITAVESTPDLQAEKAEAESAVQRRREPVTSATSAAEKEEVAKDLHGGGHDDDDDAGQRSHKPEEKASE